jgi:hypothetical protein
MPGWLTTLYNYLSGHPEAMLFALGALIIASRVGEGFLETTISRSLTVCVQGALVAAAVFLAYMVLR